MSRATEELGAYIPAAHLLHRCPHCQGADDWHPDPSGPNGEEWMLCEHCALMVVHSNRVAQPAEPSRWAPEPADLDRTTNQPTEGEQT